MKYLLDTDSIINHIRGREALKENIIKSGLGISIITFGELLYGAYKSQKRDSSLQTIQGLLHDFHIEILTLNQTIMHEYAKLKSDLEIAGARLDDFDLLIGATALVYSLSLLTKNIRHFKRIPNLKLAE